LAVHFFATRFFGTEILRFDRSLAVRYVSVSVEKLKLASFGW
jgi:hypothetical protein